MPAKDADVIYIRLRSKTPPHEWLVHPDLMPRMIQDATERETNLSDLALQIVCARLGVAYTPVPRRSNPDPGKDEFSFGAFPALTAALARAYPKGRIDGVRQILSQHYSLPVPDRLAAKRGGRPRRVDPAVTPA